MNIRQMVRSVLPVCVVEHYERRRLQYIYECSVCGSGLAQFNRIDDWLIEGLDKHEYIHSIFCCETLNMLKYKCPACGASDRSRLCAVYLTEKLGRMDESAKCKLLDISPTPSLATFIKKNFDVEYRSADLHMKGVDDNVDIMDMKTYSDDSFDAFICSHVLEHVSDDREAMKELCRIVKPDGWGIVMVPISLALEDVYEDPTITDEAGRWKHFGQNDHVRLYSKQGFVNRLQESGFKVNQLGIDYFGAHTFDKHGIHHRSVLYVVKKKEEYQQSTSEKRIESNGISTTV